MTRKDWTRVGIAAIIGLWVANILAAVVPDFAGLWVGVPFVAVYAAWNWPEKETHTRGN